MHKYWSHLILINNNRLQIYLYTGIPWALWLYDKWWVSCITHIHMQLVMSALWVNVHVMVSPGHMQMAIPCWHLIPTFYQPLYSLRYLQSERVNLCALGRQSVDSGRCFAQWQLDLFKSSDIATSQSKCGGYKLVCWWTEQ